MTPPTVNAYYDPQKNDINFPAGILQPPLFSALSDAAPNYGDTGATVGHELTHAFDDEGSQFDAEGNLRDWWTDADRKAFEGLILTCHLAQRTIPSANFGQVPSLGPRGHRRARTALS